MASILVWPCAVRAADYGAEIEATSQAELDDLHAEGVLSDESLEILSELLQTGVDLDTASRDEIYALPGLSYADVDRILKYRARVGHIRDPFELSEAGVLNAAQVTRLLPFVVLGNEPVPLKNLLRKARRGRGAASSKKPHGAPAISGRAQVRVSGMVGDPVAPPVAASARAKLPANFSAGFAVATTRLQLGTTRYDRSQGALVAQGPRYRVALPKLFVEWRTARVSVLAGTFRLGFAERLTLDNTRRRDPDDIYPDDVVGTPQGSLRFCKYSTAGGAPAVCEETGIRSLYVSPDIDFQEGFRGVAASLRNLPLGSVARLSIYGFGSYQPRSVYQYEIFDRRGCADPRDDAEDCAAPPVFEAPDGTRRFAFATLHHIYDELAGGGHASVDIAQGTGIGLTGYYAVPTWRVPGIALDFQESSRYPFGGPFGALGMNGKARAGAFAFFVEGARSFDRTPGGGGGSGAGGGFGVTQRSIASFSGHEIELSLRYYAPNFANPYARAVSAPDELEGTRARNELGARLRYYGTPSAVVRLRTMYDVWSLPSDGRAAGSAGTVNLEGHARIDLSALSPVELGVWVDHSNKDLAHNGAGLCYDAIAPELDFELDDDSARACHGELSRLTGRVAFMPNQRWLSAAVQYSHALVTDPKYGRSYRQDALLSTELALRPFKPLLLRCRSRYVDRAMDDDDYLERSLLTTIDVHAAPAHELMLRARYAVASYLDQRASTLARQPNPEQSFMFQVESRF